MLEIVRLEMSVWQLLCSAGMCSGYVIDFSCPFGQISGFFFFFLTAFLKVLASLPFRHDFRMRSSYIASLRLVDLTSNPLRCL